MRLDLPPAQVFVLEAEANPHGYIAVVLIHDQRDGPDPLATDPAIALTIEGVHTVRHILAIALERAEGGESGVTPVV